MDQGSEVIGGDVVTDHDPEPDSSAISVRAASVSPSRLLSRSFRIRWIRASERVDSRPKSSVSRI